MPKFIFKSISLFLAIMLYDVINTIGSTYCSLVFVITYNPVTGTFGSLKRISSSHVYLINQYKKRTMLLINNNNVRRIDEVLPHTRGAYNEQRKIVKVIFY